MKAAVLREVNRPLVVEDLELQEPGPGEVLVRYAASGVCHSDLNIIQGHASHPLPVVLGHEGAGTVEQVGQGVTRVRPGDHIITIYRPTCGECRWCATGRPNLCILGEAPSHTMLDGTTRLSKNGQPIYHQAQVSSHAEQAVLLDKGVVPIRKDAPLDRVSLIACGVMAGVGAAINRAKVAPGSSVAVFGCGGVGLNVVQGADIAGAARIIAVDIYRNKLEMAETFGATHLVDASKEDPVARIKELTGGSGADYSFEVIGTTATVEQAFLSISKGGMCLMIGVCPEGSRLSLAPSWFSPEKVLTRVSFGSARQLADIPMLVDMYMAGRLKLDELVSRTLTLEEINTAYVSMQRGEVARSVVLF